MSGVRSKVTIRKPETFPKTYEKLKEEALQIMESEYCVLQLDESLTGMDAMEVMLILEDEYGVYFDDMKEDGYTPEGIILELSVKLGIKKEK